MNKTLFSLFLLSLLSLHGYAGSEKNWTVSCNDYHADYTGAPVANGTLGVLPWKEPFSVRHIILNHIFELNDNAKVNCVVKGINPFNIVMTVDGKTIDGNDLSDWKQEIDMRRACHNSYFLADGKVNVEYSVMALRNLPYSAIMRITLKAREDAEVTLSNSMSIPSDEYRNATFVSRKFKFEKPLAIIKTNAETSHGRYGESASAAFIPEKGNFDVSNSEDGKSSLAKIKLQAGETATITLGTAICTTHDFSDPYSESEREVIYLQLQGIDHIISAHQMLWKDLWRSDIEIEGDDEAQQVVRLALYNLYSYCRPGTGLSISPMGLSSQGYNGHIFWDAEIWMFPPMLLLNTDLAESMIDYRCNRLAAAKTRAAAYGYQGAMFPWESDDFGQEATPTFATTGQFEQHITGDIAFAAWNYYCVKQDKEWLKLKGWPLIKAAAEFWTSRVNRNADGSFSIRNVVGADEYAEGIDDNAYTNGAAISALKCAVAAAKTLGIKAPQEWTEIAQKLRILKLNNGVTAEYEGYNGQTIKQADANLLAYPFSIITDKNQIKKDLDYYVEKIDKKYGPAMAFGVLSVLYNRIGDTEKAEETFRRSYRPNMRPPFCVFAETPSSHNPYFATGAGSMLQAVINGFGGLSIKDGGIVQQKSSLPASWKRLTITGVGKDKKTYTVVNGQ